MAGMEQKSATPPVYNAYFILECHLLLLFLFLLNHSLRLLLLLHQLALLLLRSLLLKLYSPLPPHGCYLSSSIDYISLSLRLVLSWILLAVLFSSSPFRSFLLHSHSYIPSYVSSALLCVTFSFPSLRASSRVHIFIICLLSAFFIFI